MKYLTFQLLSASFLTLLSLASVSLHAQEASRPVLWVGPPNVSKGQPFRELFEQPAAWQQARSRMTGLFYADHALADFSDDDLRRWFPQIKLWNLKLSMEVGAVKPWGTTGAVAFQKSRKNWDRLLADGADIDTIVMDEPLATTIGTLHQPVSYAVEQTAAYVALVRQNYPSWKIVEVEPYPAFQTRQLVEFIDALQARLQQMQVRGVDSVRLDVDYMNFEPGNVNGGEGWRGVKKMEIEMRLRGLPFGMIYWGANIPLATKQGKLTPMTWETAILGQGDAYHEAGGRPDEFVIEDWVKSPEHSLPENTPGTFMHSVDAFINKFLP